MPLETRIMGIIAYGCGLACVVYVLGALFCVWGK